MVKNRANTKEQKKEILDRLLNAWEMSPELRLGQLLENGKDQRHDDLFYVEDYNLITDVEKFVLECQS